MAKIKPKYSNCVGCNNREYSIENFYEKPENDSDEFSNGIVPFCKKCCENMLKYYIKKTGSLQSAMYYTCARINVPYIRKPYEAVIKTKNEAQKESKKPKEDYEYDLFGWYMGYLWGKCSMMKPTDCWYEFSDSDVNPQTDVSIKSKEAIQLEMKKYELDWGVQDSIEDYEFLTYVYGKYTQDLEEITPQQDDLIRDLCQARLDKRKIDDGRKNNEDVSKVQNRILVLLNKLKFDNFNANKSKTLSEQFIANKITMIDENNVEDIYNNPCLNKDYNKIDKYYKDIVLRTLGNMLVGNKDFGIDFEDIKQYDLNDE